MPKEEEYTFDADFEECDSESFFKWLESLPPVPKDTVRTL
jgi:hypothetical protein